MAYTPEELHDHLERLEDKVEDISTEKENGMDNIAGLLALMQNNKNMGLPGLIALCREKGYDRAWNNEGSFMFVFLLLFLMGNGGAWGNWGNRQAAADIVGADNIATITSLYDRIAAAQNAATSGTTTLQTNLCSSIAEVMAAIRNQGDRVYDATRNVGDTVRNCCCAMESQMATLQCKVDGVSRDIRETSSLINAKVELEALKAENARAAMECRILQAQKDCCCELNSRFDKLECKLDTNRMTEENARLQREVDSLKLYKSQSEQTAALIAALKTSSTSTGTGTTPAA